MDTALLVKRCKEGDRKALGQLYQEFLKPMHEVVAHYITNPDARRDIIHDGFIIAFKSIHSLKDSSKIEGWLSTIMKNLSLHYLKDEANHISVPMSDVALPEIGSDEYSEDEELSWNELNALIDTLPEGYGKVFRLAVLDGLSHKEIGTLLGIAPHSSSSQLTRAKRMLRQIIIHYKAELLVLFIGTVAVIIRDGLSRNKGITVHESLINEKEAFVADNAENTVNGNGSLSSTQNGISNPTIKKINRTVASLSAPEIYIDSITDIEKDTVITDSLKQIQSHIHKEEYIAQQEIPSVSHKGTSEWSLSLAYSGSPGRNNVNRYYDSGISLPSDDHDKLEVVEKTRHYMPFTIGLSLNKSLNDHWGIETGLRYSFLRSDIFSESKYIHKQSIQRIHYIGASLKFNYRIFTNGSFSLYGHGGGALDIPVKSRQSVWESSQDLSLPSFQRYHINAPLQWSVESGIGIQYHFTPSLSIYAEPSLRYYFDPSSKIKTIRQQKPFEFSIPLGLRLTW